MKTRSREHKKAQDEALEALAEKAELGEDVNSEFTGKRVAKQRINVDFPYEMLLEIDAECRRLGVTRQGWIKMVCDDRLRESAIGWAKRKAV
ncbi:CopG family transcriptional regulator [Myxococcota bacterium]|nr:CopG family transcriptional regulator [Myxococcota bacterium]